MFSLLDPSYVYSNLSSDMCLHDENIVSDMWTLDGRDVYRGMLDPTLDHAYVYWLYDEDTNRIGCSEHALDDRSRIAHLWFRETEFGTMFQEDGWDTDRDIWSFLPAHATELYMSKGWTTATSFLENSLRGPVRVITPQMLLAWPTVYRCESCRISSLSPLPTHKQVTTRPLDVPDKQKCWFVDEDLVTHRYPSFSCIWAFIASKQPGHDGSSWRGRPRAPEPLQATEQERPEPLPPSPPPSQQALTEPPHPEYQTADLPSLAHSDESGRTELAT